MKILNISFMTLLITQNIHIKISKHSQKQSLFFFFSKIKNVIWLYLKIKNLNILMEKSQRSIYLLIKKN
jgi:hypothetical protein